MCIYIEAAFKTEKRSKLLAFLGKSEDLASLGPRFHQQLLPGAKQQPSIEIGQGSAVHLGPPVHLQYRCGTPSALAFSLWPRLDTPFPLALLSPHSS